MSKLAGLYKNKRVAEAKDNLDVIFAVITIVGFVGHKLAQRKQEAESEEADSAA